MAARPVLVVMIVRDAGLRSALAARLSVEPFDLLTADKWSDELVDRKLIRPPAVLVIDEESAAGREGAWIKAQHEAGLFARIVVLTVDAPEADTGHDWLMQINQGEAIDVLSQLFTDIPNLD